MHMTPAGNSARHFAKAGYHDVIFIRTCEKISRTFTARGKDIMFSKQKFWYFIDIFIYHKTLDKWAMKTADFFPTVSNET